MATKKTVKLKHKKRTHNLVINKSSVSIPLFFILIFILLSSQPFNVYATTGIDIVDDYNPNNPDSRPLIDLIGSTDRNKMLYVSELNQTYYVYYYRVGNDDKIRIANSTDLITWNITEIVSIYHNIGNTGPLGEGDAPTFADRYRSLGGGEYQLFITYGYWKLGSALQFTRIKVSNTSITEDLTTTVSTDWAPYAASIIFTPDQRLYIIAEGNIQGSKLYRSADFGSSWDELEFSDDRYSEHIKILDIGTKAMILYVQYYGNTLCYKLLDYSTFTLSNETVITTLDSNEYSFDAKTLTSATSNWVGLVYNNASNIYYQKYDDNTGSWTTPYQLNNQSISRTTLPALSSALRSDGIVLNVAWAQGNIIYSKDGLYDVYAGYKLSWNASYFIFIEEETVTSGIYIGQPLGSVNGSWVKYYVTQTSPPYKFKLITTNIPLGPIITPQLPPELIPEDWEFDPSQPTYTPVGDTTTIIASQIGNVMAFLAPPLIVIFALCYLFIESKLSINIIPAIIIIGVVLCGIIGLLPLWISILTVVISVMVFIFVRPDTT